MSPINGTLEEAVRSAIVAVAHAHALDRISTATDACERLGALSAGRWRAAARELSSIEDDLERATEQAQADLEQRAAGLDLEFEALWTAGESAAFLDAFADDALEELGDDEDLSARLLQGDALFGVSFVEDADEPNRGATLLFGWADPLQPAVWRWEATWLEIDDPDGSAPPAELDLFEVSEIQLGEAMLRQAQGLLDTDEAGARQAFLDVAQALTRSSLIAAAAIDEEDRVPDDEDDEDEA